MFFSTLKKGEYAVIHYIIVLFITAFISTNVDAKNKIILVSGGADPYFAPWSEAFGADKGFYDPLVQSYPSDNIEAIAQESGLDAIAINLADEIYGEYQSVIYFGATSTESIVREAKNGYQSGDTVHLVGYSAGTKSVLRAAHALSLEGVEIGTLSLIDAYSVETRDIPLLTGGSFLVGEWVGSMPYEIPRNVKNVYAYYQDSSFFGIEGNNFGGHRNFSAQDPSQTQISTYYINNTTHNSIDNDRRVWRGIVIKIKSSVHVISAVSDDLDICDYPGYGDSSEIVESIRASYSCADHDNSIEGTIDYDSQSGEVVFTPHHDDLGGVTLTAVTGLQFSESTWSPALCQLDHVDLAVLDYQTGYQYDVGIREIPQSKTVEIKERMQQGGADAESCRLDENLKTVETGFYKQVGDGPWTRLIGQDGERYQKTKMTNLRLGDTHTESVVYTVTENPGTRITLWSCLDENKDLNQVLPGECHSDTFVVASPPAYNVAVSGVQDGDNVAGLQWSLPVRVSNLLADLPVSIELRVMLDNKRLPNLKVEHWEMRNNGSLVYDISGVQPQPGTYILSVCFEGNSAFAETSTADNCSEGKLVVRPPPPLPVRPFGHIDQMNCSGFKGWVRDQSSGSRRIEIYRYGTRQFSLSTNVWRPDVQAEFGGNGRAGYDLEFPWYLHNGTTYTWKVLAIDDGVGGYLSKTEIGKMTFRCQNAAPWGRLEHATRYSVHGWGWDPNRPNNPIGIRVYTQWGYRGGSNAPHYRGDLPGNKRHAFNITVDDLCYGVGSEAHVKVAYMDALSGYRWSNILRLNCS